MAQLVKNLSSGESVLFDQGKFDVWCVYVVGENGKRTAPNDISYFTDFQNISKNYPCNKVYHDFVKIYKRTNNKINPLTIQIIDELIEYYKPKDKAKLEKWFTVVYAGMIAEENKSGAILKKH